MGVNVPILLSIAGFDPASGAGVTADVKTAAAHGVYALACVTALTVQSTQGVVSSEPTSARLIRPQLEEVSRDIPPDAVRIGMLATGEIASAVADFLEQIQPKWVALDPIIRSSSGAVLTGEAGVQVILRRLLALATVVTPNTDEARELTGIAVTDPRTQSAAAEKLQSLGAKNVVITGGHLPNNEDLLRLESGEEHRYAGEKIESAATHGTGCAFATALACNLALGNDLVKSVGAAKQFVREAIAAAYPIGHGNGPMNHLYRFRL